MSGGLRLRWVRVLALLTHAALAGAAPQPVDDEALRARLGRLETELRCLVCQNQTLADSSAPLAEDLRREVRRLADAGKRDDEIRDYLVARYGDFVLYDPPLRARTLLLWGGPALLLIAGALAWLRMGRRGRAADDAEALARGRDLIDADRRA